MDIDSGYYIDFLYILLDILKYKYIVINGMKNIYFYNKIIR